MFDLVPSMQLNETAFTNKLLINDEKSTIFTSFFSSIFFSLSLSPLVPSNDEKKNNNLHFYFSCTKSHQIDDDYILLYFFSFLLLFFVDSSTAILLCRHDSGLSVRRAVCAVFYIFWTFITYYHRISQFE